MVISGCNSPPDNDYILDTKFACHFDAESQHRRWDKGAWARPSVLRATPEGDTSKGANRMGTSRETLDHGYTLRTM